MRAARFYGQSDIRLDDVPKPQPKDGEVIVNIEWGGICGMNGAEEAENKVLTKSACDRRI
jgi:hypothetical protein